MTVPQRTALEILLDQFERDLQAMPHVTPAQMIRAIKRIRFSAATKAFVMPESLADEPIQATDPEVRQAREILGRLREAGRALVATEQTFDKSLVDMCELIGDRLSFAEVVTLLALDMIQQDDNVAIPSRPTPVPAA